MASRIFLTIVGLVYVGLAAWCALKPAETSAAVGFTLRPGTGQSEFLVVYAGLQLALGCIFLLPWLRSEYLVYSLLSCVIVHGSLVVFRAISIALYGRLENTTYAFSALELALFLAAAVLFWKR